MCESCAVFTDVFCLHFWTSQYTGFSPLHIAVGLLSKRELEGGVGLSVGKSTG